MNFTVSKRTYADMLHLSKSGKRLALRRWLAMPRNHEPIIAGRAPGRGWTPIRVCFKEVAC